SQPLSSSSTKPKTTPKTNNAEILNGRNRSKEKCIQSLGRSITWKDMAFFLVGRLNVIFVMPSSEVTRMSLDSWAFSSAPRFPWLGASDEELKLDTRST
ncbi:mCG146150, partial [Mus musculus]